MGKDFELIQIISNAINRFQDRLLIASDPNGSGKVIRVSNPTDLAAIIINTVREADSKNRPAPIEAEILPFEKKAA